jgi:heat shock protein HslJ
MGQSGAGVTVAGMTSGRGRGGAGATRARRAAAVAAAGVLGVGVLAACGVDEGPAGAASADDLEGRAFVATGADGVDLVGQVTLAFEDGAVIGNGGCNTMRGGYTVDEGVLQVEELAQTMKACDPAKTAQDAWLAALLSDEPEASLAGDRLTVRTLDDSLMLVDADAADAPATSDMTVTPEAGG